MVIRPFEGLVLTHLKVHCSLPTEPVDDAVNMGLHSILQDLGYSGSYTWILYKLSRLSGPELICR